MSFAAVFAYEVEPGSVEAFEAVYGSDGEWARFFGGAEGYVGTELLGSAEGRYLVIDRWRSAADYETFLAANAAEYRERGAEAERLYVSETVIGRFETCAPASTRRRSP